MAAVLINIPIKKHEVPDLRESVGWERRDEDFSALLERCNFWAGLRDTNGTLIAFGYICGTGLQHGYMENITADSTLAPAVYGNVRLTIISFHQKFG